MRAIGERKEGGGEGRGGGREEERKEERKKGRGGKKQGKEKKGRAEEEKKGNFHIPTKIIKFNFHSLCTVIYHTFTVCFSQ